MNVNRLLVILGLSILFIVLFCDDIVEGSENETIEPETGENKMEVDDMIKLQMLQMEVLKDIVKNKNNN